MLETKISITGKYKTTILMKLKTFLELIGYKVLIFPEKHEMEVSRN